MRQTFERNSKDGADEPRLWIDVRLASGRRFAAEAAPGLHVMELIRAHGIAIRAECGGAGACATCHVRVARRWQRHLPVPSEDEAAKLDGIPNADDDSRLACQIVMREELDGLELELAPNSLQLPDLQAAE